MSMYTMVVWWFLSHLQLNNDYDYGTNIHYEIINQYT